MKFFQQILTVVLALMSFTASAGASGDSFPDGTDIPAWFNDTSRIDIDTLGRKYVITAYGVKTTRLCCRQRQYSASSILLLQRAGE